jgi:RNA polymerase sigma-70 factor (ECF subfamily)
MGAASAEVALTDGGRDAEAVWWRAWEAERKSLYGFLRRQLRDPDAAEDLLQETFVRAIRSGRIEEEGRLRSYLFTIAQNLVADHWRSRRRRPVTVEGPDGPPNLDEVADERGEWPESSVSRRRLERRLGEAMAALPDRYRAAFRLAAIEQRSYREVGETMGWSLDQVCSNVHRARKKLIAELGEDLLAEDRA